MIHMYKKRERNSEGVLHCSLAKLDRPASTGHFPP